MPTASPYILDGPQVDAALADSEPWRRRSFDPSTYWADRKSLSSNDALSLSSLNSSTPTKHQQMHHRLSAPSLQGHQQRPSSSSTAPLSSSSSTGFRPWSSGGSSSSSSLADDSSGSPLTTTNVRFIGVSKKESHCVYMVHVDTGTEQFVVQKRYSQFRNFRAELFATLQQVRHCGNGPCKQLLQLTQIKFPRRKLVATWRKDADLIVARERLLLLQHFVEAMLRVYRMAPKRQLRCCVNIKCSAMEAIRGFLQIAARSDADEGVRVSSGSVDLAASMRDSELVRARSSSSERDNIEKSSSFSERDSIEKSSSFSEQSSRRQARGFPPPTRASLPAMTDVDHQFEQLYTITEDTELVHLHA